MQSGAMMMQQAQMARHGRRGMPRHAARDDGRHDAGAASGAISGMMPMATRTAADIDMLMAGGIAAEPGDGTRSSARLNQISGRGRRQLGGATMPGMGAGPIPGAMQRAVRASATSSAWPRPAPPPAAWCRRRRR